MWKNIYYNNTMLNYEVNEEGIVRNSLTKKILVGNLKKTGYVEYCLYDLTSTPVYCLAHRLVLEAFKPRIDSEELTINHIDGDKTNNNLLNLEWATYSENEQHAWNNQLNHAHMLRKVNQYTLKHEFIKTYASLIDAKKATGAVKIREVANGERKSSGGFYWEWTENFKVEDRGKRKQVAQLDLNDNVIQIFESVSEAARITNSNRKGISAVCLNKQKTCNNFKWKFVYKNNDEMVQNNDQF